MELNGTITENRVDLGGTITSKKTLTGALAPTGGSSGPAVMARGTGTDSVISVSATNPNTASGDGAFAAGKANEASGNNAVAMGYNNIASGIAAIAIGGQASGKARNQATQAGAVALGQSNEASNYYSVAIGKEAVASGVGAVALGYGNEASGNASFAAGGQNVAGARCSTAIGLGTEASGGNSLVAGKYNEIDDAAQDATTGEREFALIIGNGTDDNNRSNAMTLDWDGNLEVAGKLTLGAAPTANMDAATKQYVDNAIPTVPSPASSGTPAMDGTASRGSSAQYARADHVHPTDTSRAAASEITRLDTAVSAKADKITEVTVSTAGAVTQALDAGKLYHFTGALTALTITLNAPASGDPAQYHFNFNSGSTAPTLTMPNTVTMPDSFAVEANKRYEVDVLNNYGAVMAWS